MSSTTIQTVTGEELESARQQLCQARRVIVKVGSNVLVGQGPGSVDDEVFEKIVAEVATLDGEKGHDIFFVSSGAIAVARRDLKMEFRIGNETIAHKQALAAIGQPRLMHLYQQEFAKHGKRVAQVLVSPENLSERERFINARNTLRALALLDDVVPIINENDTTSTAEIRIGDNDSLAAQIIPLIDADALIILSDVDALYDADPRSNEGARPIRSVYADDPEIDGLARPADPRGRGSGGMATKIKAARIASSSGVPTVIAAGREPGVLRRVLEGETVGTVFVPGARKQARKTWLEYASRPAGTLYIDSGASRALREQGRSLLSVGVTRVEGEFSSGSPVDIAGPSGSVIGRGLANYSSRELAAIAGHSSDRIVDILGFSNGDTVVHRDDLTLLGG